MTAGKVMACACSIELLGPFSAISGRWPILIFTGLETPLEDTTRNSRALSLASDVAVSFTTNRLSSLAAAGSARLMAPEVDSIEMAGLGAAGGGALVALRPDSPLKMKPVTAARFVPLMVRSIVVPRWIHSGEIESIFGTGCAIAENDKKMLSTAASLDNGAR